MKMEQQKKGKNDCHTIKKTINTIQKIKLKNMFERCMCTTCVIVTERKPLFFKNCSMYRNWSFLLIKI